MKRPTRCFVLAGALLLSSAAKAHEAHTHGQARVDIAVDGEVLSVQLASPLMNLFGFERLPRNAAETTAVRQAVGRLRRGEALFVTPAAADCRLASASLDFGALGDGLLAADGSPPEAARSRSDAHADLDAAYTFHCGNPSALHELELRLFEAFPAIRRVTVQLLAPAGQAGATLTPANARVKW